MAASDCPLPGLSSSSQADRGFVFGARERKAEEGEAGSYIYFLMNGMSCQRRRGCTRN